MNDEIVSGKEILKFKNEIEKIRIQCSKELCSSLRKILDNLKEKLFEPILDSEDNIFGDFTSIFQTGIIIENILCQKSIILKNLTNLSPAVLERFNDLLNYNPKITINEDFCGTLTGVNKELSDFSSTFKVIGISSTETFNNLSEAAKNRFTLLFTSSYSDEEKKIVLKNYSNNTNPNFFNFMKEYSIRTKKNISFPSTIKILNIFNKLTKTNMIKEDKCLILSLYYSLFHNMNTNNEKTIFIKLINEIYPISSSYIFINGNNNEENEKTPFIFDDLKVKSIRTDLSITTNNYNQNYKKDQLAFVNSFNDMIDIIFTCLSINFPLIIEGNCGRGKKTAIDYVSKILGYEMISFSISNSTTIDNLFCKINPVQKGKELVFEVIESTLLKTIKGNSTRKLIIVLENLEQASQNILDALIPLFDPSREDILLPTGVSVKKSIFNLIATFDPSTKGNSMTNILPLSIQNSSILFKCNELTKNELIKVSEKMNLEIDDYEISRFLSDFIEVSNYSNRNQLKQIFSLNDVKKFCSFRINSENAFDYEVFAKILLINRFPLEEDIKNASNFLKYDNYDLWPEFYYDPDDEKIFYVSPLESNNSISIKIKKSFNESEKLQLEDSILSLTPEQRICLIFMILSIKSNIPCVLQGPTASGKSYLVRLLANILGEELTVFDLNNDSGISLLTGQLIPAKGISMNEIEEITKLFKEAQKIDDLNFLFQNSDFHIEDSSNWKPYHFRNILNKIYTLNEKIYEENNLLLNKIKTKLLEELSFMNHLKTEDSLFIKSMMEGKWVLLDGIESAQPELFERISSLCEMDNPILNLFEKGPDYIYSKESDKFPIHKNFRLFITYNPFESESQKRLSPGFLNKCTTFSLTSIDNNLYNSAIFLSGLFQNTKYIIENGKKKFEKGFFEDKNHEFASKFALMHLQAKELSIKENDKFAGKKSFSTRALKFIYNTIFNRINNYGQIDAIKSVIEDCYSNSYYNSNYLKNILIKKFCEEPQIKLIQFLKKDEKKLDKKYDIIHSVISHLINDPNLSINFKDFLINVGEYKLEDLKKNDSLYYKLDELRTKLIPSNKYYTSFIIIDNIVSQFKEVICMEDDEKNNKKKWIRKTINNPICSEKEPILTIPQRKYFFLVELLKNKNEDFFLDLTYREDFKIYYKEKKANIFDDCNKNHDFILKAFTIAYAYPELKEILNEDDSDDDEEDEEEKNDNEIKNLFQNIPNFQKDLLKLVLTTLIFNRQYYKNKKQLEMKEEVERCIDLFDKLKQLCDEKFFIISINDEYSNHSIDINEINFNASKNTLKLLNDLNNEKIDDLNNKFSQIYENTLLNWIKKYNFFDKEYSEQYYKYKNDKEMIKLEDRLTKLKKKIQKNNTNNDKHLEKLEYCLSNFKPNKDNIKEIENYVTESIALSKIRNPENKTKIKFPILPYNNDNISKSNFHLLIKELISYSINYFLTENIKNQKNIIKCFIQLYEQKELNKYVNKYEMEVMQNKANINSLTLQFQELLKSILVTRLYLIDPRYINKNNIIQEINKYYARDCITDEDMNWMYQIYQNYDNDFILYIPNFDNKTIIHMFVFELYRELKNGFLIKEKKIVLSEQEKKNIFDLVESKSKDFEIINKILYIILNTYVKEENDKFKEKILNINNSSKDNTELINQILDDSSYDFQKPHKECLIIIKDLFKYFSFNNSEKINTNDLFFVKENNWANDLKNYYRDFPSLFYFLINYPNCESELKKALQKCILKIDENTFPLYLIFLRILSSNKNLQFTYSPKYKFGKKLIEILKEQIISYIEEKDKPINNFDWIGLLSHIDNILINNKMINIFNYLRFLCNINIELEIEELYQILFNCFKDLFKKILEKIFLGEIEKIFNETINDKNEALYFINIKKKINLEIDKFINEREKNIYQDINEEVKKLLELFEMDENKKLSELLKNSIINDIEKEKKEKLEKHLQDTINKLNDELEKLQTKKVDYLKFFYIFYNNDKKNYLIFHNQMKKIVETKDFLYEVNEKMFNNKIEISYIEISIPKEFSSSNIEIKNEKKKKTKN